MNIFTTLLKIVEILIRLSRQMLARANADGLVAQEAKTALLAIRRALLKTQANAATEGTRVVTVPVIPIGQTVQQQRNRARNSPIASLDWSATDGRGVTTLINGKAVRLARRFNTILEILDAQPIGIDGLAGFIGYDALRKEVGKREGRGLKAHSVSQSLSLLARKFQEQGLDPYWIERDSKLRRVRLLIRRSSTLTGGITAGTTTSHATAGGTTLARSQNPRAGSTRPPSS